jgi:hypothetical protein
MDKLLWFDEFFNVERKYLLSKLTWSESYDLELQRQRC